MQIVFGPTNANLSCRDKSVAVLPGITVIQFNQGSYFDFLK